MSGRWVVAVAVLAGCYEPSLARPEGPAGDGASAADSAPGADARPFACSGEIFKDDFEDGDLLAGGRWDVYVDQNGTVSEADGHLITGFYDPVPAGAVAGVNTSTIFDLRGFAVIVEVGRLVDAQTYLAIDVDGANRVVIRHEAGTLSVRQRVGGEAVDVMSRRYDPANDVFWRIGEEAGTTYYDTSRDGQTWIPLASSPNAIAFDSTVVLLEIDSIVPTSSPGETHFELAAICPRSSG